ADTHGQERVLTFGLGFGYGGRARKPQCEERTENLPSRNLTRHDVTLSETEGSIHVHENCHPLCRNPRGVEHRYLRGSAVRREKMLCTGSAFSGTRVLESCDDRRRKDRLARRPDRLTATKP